MKLQEMRGTVITHLGCLIDDRSPLPLLLKGKTSLWGKLLTRFTPPQVCSNCRPKLTCCPTCRGPLGSIRNLAMEKVANSVLFPCKYASSGCEVTLPHTDKTEHEELCEFRPYSCPCPGASCKWQGSLDAVMPHLMHQHKSITTLQVRHRLVSSAAYLK